MTFDPECIAVNLEEIQIVVDSWIIQDGNYGDFGVGETVRCALEFFSHTLQPSLQSHGSLVHLGQNRYRVCAQVPYAHSCVWVIDVGVKLFEEATPPEFAIPGLWVEGEIEIGIDPFFFKEYLRNAPGMPDLFNDWDIVRIERDDTPWLESTGGSGGKVLSRDTQRVRWTDVQLTDAWNDDDGRAAYLMHLKPSGIHASVRC